MEESGWCLAWREHLGCSIMPDRPVGNQWDHPKKMERHFMIKQVQPRGTALTHFFINFPISLCKWNLLKSRGNESWGNESVQFSVSIWNSKFRPEQKLGGPEYSSRTEPKPADLPIWLPTDISGILSIMESILGQSCSSRCLVVLLSHNSSRALSLNFLLLGFLFSRVCSVGRPAP